ncbi:aminotransferase class IV [SAR86 cluster bacterium]|nr:aminotransferase class IV [SAR86 cluster bacterium]
MSICYLNGDYLNIEEARISPLDRGFIFGDAIYEVIACYDKKPFKLKLHIERLLKNLESIKIDLELSNSNLSDIINQVINKNNSVNQVIYLQISRGPEAIRDHTPQDNSTPTIFVSSFPMKVIPKIDIEPVEVIMQDDFRWRKSSIKATSLLASVIYKMEAKEKNVSEVILHEKGLITEGSVSNIFCVKDKIIKTPSLEANILPGVTRKTLIEIIQKSEYGITEVDISIDELFDSDEVWISNTTKGVVPVFKIDNQIILNKQEKFIFKDIFKLFMTEIQSDKSQ